MKKISILLAAVLVVSLLPATALAQEDTARADDAVERIVENLKDRAEKAIEKRMDTIERATEALQEAEHLTDEHERALLAELDSSAAGLTELGRQIEDATTLEELRELIPLIFEDYRIYAVVVPKAHLVVVADTLMAAAGRIELVAGSLQDAIDRFREAGFDTTEAEEALAEMNASLGEAVALARPVPDTVLPLAPADWPDPVQGIIEEAHSDVRSARHHVESAIRSAHEVGRILRELLKMS